MTQPSRANRCIIADLPGPELDDEWRRHLERHRFGGICLFRRNVQSPEQLARLIADIRQILGGDALIGIDQEGGAVLRVLDLPQLPSPMALGAADDAELAHEVGGIAARGLISLGINWNFAPVLDVQNNARNPVIGERGFGADPARVAQLGVAWALGSEAEGVLSSVKHFPGHGDTGVDSHLALPVVEKGLEELEVCEWLPFRAAVAANVGSVMTAHILYPALDSEMPATLSPAILTGLLREKWGYEGVIVTDSTDMQGVAARFGAEAAPLALIAGADAVLACTHGDMGAQTRQVEAVERALRDGRLSRERLEQALSRLARAAARFPAAPRPYPPRQREADEATVSEVARRAVTAIGPVSAAKPGDKMLLLAPTHAEVGGPYEDALSGSDLAAALSPALPNLQTMLYPPEAPLTALSELRAAAPDFVLVATTSRWALSPEELQLIRAARELNAPALHLALWNPYHVPAVGLPALITYGFRQNVLEALRAVLKGAPAPGRLPVTFAGATAEGR